MTLCGGAAVQEGEVGALGSHTDLVLRENRGWLEIESDMSHIKGSSISNVFLITSVHYYVF